MGKKKKKTKIYPEILSLPRVGIDTHAHLSMSKLEELPSIIERALFCGISKIGNVFLSSTEYYQYRDFFSNYPIFFILGIHPHDASKVNNQEIENIKKIILEDRNVKALGEVGLDYYYNFSSPQEQKKILEVQLSIAKDLDIPVVIHSRDAKEDTFSILKNFNLSRVLFHCFSYGKEEAKKVLEQGWLLSYSGALTFTKNISLQEVAKYVPLESVVLETDSPYLTPMPYRGKTNQPAYMLFTAYALSKIIKKDVLSVWEQTAKNSRLFFNL
ncbi:MAG: TatD DNase family protein [Desulfonauticus sp.]|jgi:TatD DNase family protein|nr:MAG: Hydrolase, TatD family [Desulfonauticus sp. 38_4375]MDK2921087.1 TatD DNase family protein [Desulfonauticus sp.]